jgi:diazepam-binding inhibitor (GABA receptor modulator, acyl-CoA-binding protein)
LQPPSAKATPSPLVIRTGRPWVAVAFAPMTPTESFEDAQKRVKALTESPSNDHLLELYALFKQASVGDVSGSRPGMMDFKGRAKFDAWTKKKGTAKDAAITAYVSLVDRLTQKK